MILRRFRTRFAVASLFALVLAVSVVVVASSAASASGAAGTMRTKYKTCNISGSESKMGPSYVTSLKVKKVTCATARVIVRGYYKCRIANGGVSGTCSARVNGFTCKETRSGIDVQFNAKVTCHKGRKYVYHTYTQNT